MKSLSVGVAICQLLPLPSIQTLYQNMLARYCQLSLTLGEADEEMEGTLGGAEEEIEAALKACEDSSQLQLSGKAQMELQASFVGCQLSLAQLQLHKGQVWCVCGVCVCVWCVCVCVCVWGGGGGGDGKLILFICLYLFFSSV